MEPDLRDQYPQLQQVLLCRQRGLDGKETDFAVKVSERLVREHHKLIDKFAKENVVLESILQYTGKEL